MDEISEENPICRGPICRVQKVKMRFPLSNRKCDEKWRVFQAASGYYISQVHLFWKQGEGKNLQIGLERAFLGSSS